MHVAVGVLGRVVCLVVYICALNSCDTIMRNPGLLLAMLQSGRLEVPRRRHMLSWMPQLSLGSTCRTRP